MSLSVPLLALALAVCGCGSRTSSRPAAESPPAARGGACITDHGRVGNLLAYARAPLREPRSLAVYRLAPYDSAAVELVRDAAVCTRAAAAYGRAPRDAVAYDVIVLRLGGSGYLVVAPEDRTAVGEFTCNKAFLDAAFRRLSGSCG